MVTQLKKLLTLLLLIVLAAASLGCTTVVDDQSTDTEPTSGPQTGAPTSTGAASEAIVEMARPGGSVVAREGVGAIIPYSENYARPGETIEIRGRAYNNADETDTLELVPVSYDQYGGQIIDTDWVEVTPSTLELEAGETAEFTIRISVPEDATTGWYNGMIAIRSQTRPEQTHHYNVYVYEPLEEPIEQNFTVPTNADTLRIGVSWHDRGNTETDVEITLLSPNEDEVTLDNKSVQISGWISTIRSPYESTSTSSSTTITYTLDDPEVGVYTLQLLPDGPADVNYNIQINP